MMRSRNAKKIAAVLSGLDGGVAPFVRYLPPPTEPAPPPPPPPPPMPSAAEIAASRASQVAFYDQLRRFKPSAAQVFEMEQKRARDAAGITQRAPSASYTDAADAGGGYDEAMPFYDETTGSERMSISIPAVAANPTHAARLQFIAWLQENAPDLYREAVKRATSGGMAGLGADDTTTTEAKPSLWERITTAITGLAGAKAQYDLVQLNLDRAKAGQPPIDPAAVAPVVRTQVAITPEMAAELKQGAFTIGKNTLLIGAAALGAYFLLRK